MTDLLLRVEPADYVRLVARRRKAAIWPILLCGAVGAGIIWAEYRLMLIAFAVMVPALIAVIDVVAVSRSAASMGACEVRCDGEWLTLNSTTRLRVEAITMVRVQPDAVTVVEQLAPQRWRGHLLAVEGLAQEPLLARLRALGRAVKVEQASIATLMAFIWGVLANLVLGKVAGVLVLGAIGFTVKGFVDGPGPGWEAAACFGGAVASLTVMALLKAFVLRAPQT